MSRLTESAIERTFLSLLEEKPLNRITVLEISAACGVNRKTFYNHYADLNALLEAAWLKPLERAALEADGWAAGLCAMAQWLFSCRGQAAHVLCGAAERFEERVRETAYALVRGEAQRLCRQAAMEWPRQAGERLCAFYASGLSGMLVRWVREGMERDLAAQLRALETLLHGSLLSALAKAGGAEENIQFTDSV